jgi:hypothetical protein
MERTQIFDLMGELKLYGMKAAFDEIMATAISQRPRSSGTNGPMPTKRPRTRPPDEPAPPIERVIHMQTTNKKAIVSAIAGNALEWYDFTIFALMTPVIKNLFFPVDPNLPGSEINALLLTTALFGSGFFMRPVGGIALGYFADRKGRKAP